MIIAIIAAIIKVAMLLESDGAQLRFVVSVFVDFGFVDVVLWMYMNFIFVDFF